VRLDGDGVGSELGLAYILRALGKRPAVVNPGRIPHLFAFLPGAASAGEGPGAIPDDCDLVVSLDTPGLARLGAVGERLPPGVRRVNVDHHASNEHYADVNWVDPSRSSVGEMLYVLAEEACWTVGPEAATALYVAVLTDTDRFTLPNATPESLRAAAALIEAGAAHLEAAERLYRRMPLGLAHLKGQTLAAVRPALDGRVAVARMTEEMFQRTGTDPLDTQTFSEIPRNIEGAVVGVLFREMPGGRVKVSLRGRAGTNVEQVARAFGGGGHREAAGCIVEGALDEVERRVIEQLAKTLAGKEADG